jgi:hypothetical protein
MRGGGRYWLTPAYTQHIDRHFGDVGWPLGEYKAADIGDDSGAKVTGARFEPWRKHGVAAIVTEQGSFVL